MSFSEKTEQQPGQVTSENKIPEGKQEEQPVLRRSRERPPEQLKLLSHLRKQKMEAEGRVMDRRMQRKLASANVDFDERTKLAFNEKRLKATPALEEAEKIAAVTPTQKKLQEALTAAKLKMENDVKQEDYAQALLALDAALVAADGLQTATTIIAQRTEQQAERFNAIQPVLKKVKESYFNNAKRSGSIAIDNEKLSPGSDFKAYLKSLEEVEKWQSAKPPIDLTEAAKACAKLAKDAQAYLKHSDERYLSDKEQDLVDNHWNELTEEQQSSLKAKLKPNNNAKRKRQICEEGFKGARHLDLALQMEKLGTPDPKKPWSQEQEIAFNQLRAQFYFETGYKKAAGLGGQAGVNEAFWVESVEGIDRREKTPKNFIFKPKEGENPVFNSDIAKPGISAVKESLASANAKLVAEQTGIDLGVPETSVATIGGYAIEGVDPGSQKTGSIQQFEKSDGTLKDQPDSILSAVSPGEWQRGSLNDIIGLNADRHRGNFMVQKNAGPGKTPKLIAIDHGNSLPTCDDFVENAHQIGGLLGSEIKNVTLTQPNAYEPYSPDMLKGIAKLDPKAISAGMREHCKALDKVNPGLNADGMLSDEAITLSERTTTFLKNAAPVLSPAEILIAINKYKKEFANFNLDIGELSERIITEQVPLKDCYKEIMTSPRPVLGKLVDTLKDNGWDANTLLMESPDVAWKLAAGNVKNEPKGIDPAEAAKTADFVEGLKAKIKEFLAFPDKNTERAWDEVDKTRPDAKNLEQMIIDLQTTEPGSQSEAMLFFKQAASVTDTRRQVICDFLLDSSKTNYDALSGLAEGEDIAKLNTAWQNVQARHKVLQLGGMMSDWQTIKEIAAKISQRPVGPVTKKLDEAKNYIESQMPAGEKVLQDATDRLTGLRDLAKQAVTAASAGRANEVNQHVQSAKEIAQNYFKAVKEAQLWVGEVSKTFYPKLPTKSELVPALTTVKSKLETLFFKIQADVDGAEKLDKKIEAALAIVTDAADTTKNKDELLARVIEADQHSCFMLLSKAGAFEASASVDIASLKNALAAAGAENLPTEDKSRLVAICSVLVKDIVGKLKSLRDQLAKTKSAVADKLKSYPPQLDRNSPPFQKPFQEFDKLTKGQADLEGALKELTEKAKVLNEAVVKLG